VPHRAPRRVRRSVLRRLPLILFLIILLSFPLFPSLPPSILRSEPAAIVLVTAPRSTHAAAMLGFLQPSDRSHFFAAIASFTLPPLLREVRCPFLDLYVRVCSHLRSFTAPLSLSLDLLRSRTTCLSHGKISIVRRDITRTEMSCRRRELAPSFDLILGNNNYRYNLLALTERY